MCKFVVVFADVDEWKSRRKECVWQAGGETLCVVG
jgi:hypothetical protein